MLKFIVKTEKCAKPYTNPEYKITRQDYYKECLPLLNMRDSEYNILSHDKSGYIHYHESNTINLVLTKDFTLVEMVGELPKYEGYNRAHIYDIIDNTINVGGIDVPIYYMFCNRNGVIFDIYINYVSEKNRYTYNEREALMTFFKMNIINSGGDRIHYKFVSISHNFNIFNAALLCGKYFDLYDLMMDPDKNNIQKKFADIFEGFDINGLYKIFGTYFSSMIYGLDKETRNFLLQENYGRDVEETNITDFLNKIYVKEDNKTNIKKMANRIRETEVPIGEQKNKDKMKYLFKQFKLIYEALNEISKIIPDFIHIFMLSYLYHRLENKYFINTWSFNDAVIMERFKNSKINEKDKILDIYKDESPNIYNYTNVIYEGVIYPNCTENIIFQLLKLFFWDIDNEKCDENIINKYVKDELKPVIKTFFIDEIKKEREYTQMIKWIKFLYGLGKYDFLNKKIDVELDSSHKNLCLAIDRIIDSKYITKNDKGEVDFGRFFMNINDKYSATYEYDKENDTDHITLNLHKKYTMILQRKKHTFFEGGKPRDNKTNVFNMNENMIPRTFNELFTVKKIWYSDMNAYLYYRYRKYNKDDGFVGKYLWNLGVDKMRNVFETIFEDDVDLEYIKDIVDVYSDVIHNVDNISDRLINNVINVYAKYEIYNDDFTSIMLDKIISSFNIIYLRQDLPDVFWKHYTERYKEHFIKTLGEIIFGDNKIIHNVIVDIKSNIFWEKCLLFADFSKLIEKMQESIFYVENDIFWIKYFENFSREKYEILFNKYYDYSFKCNKSRVFIENNEQRIKVKYNKDNRKHIFWSLAKKNLLFLNETVSGQEILHETLRDIDQGVRVLKENDKLLFQKIIEKMSCSNIIK